MTLPVDTLLQGGKYRIVRFISSGGFGCTYEAVHTVLEQRVAIKEFFVKDFCNRDETTAHITVGTVSKRALVDKLRRKFVDEAKALFGLRNQGIVRVTDVFEENGTAYYVMDYVDGLSLSDIVGRHGAMPEARALRYIRQVAEALQYVHDHNRLHLDIKPGNIMVDNDDNAVLIDFGASKQYDEENGENTSTLMGKTPGYAPLEQMGNDVVKFLPATDIYALGATLYKLLTGITPPSANMLACGETLDPLPAVVSASTRRAIAAAMQLRKVDRPQTIGEFIALLDAPAGAAASVSEETVFDAPAAAPSEKPHSPSASPRAAHVAATKPEPASTPKTETKQTPEAKPVVQPVRKRSFFGRHKGLVAAVCAVVFAVVGFMLFRGDDGESSVSVSVSQPSGSADGHDYVDLGLSVMWATCNVGALSPAEYGDYYAWGETTPKSEYTEENSKTNGKNIGDISGNLQYDAARANWGGSWRMPTNDEMHELVDKCTWEWGMFDNRVGDSTIHTGTYGYKVTGPNGNSIFLPAAGWRYGSLLDDESEPGRYWCSTPYEGNTRDAYSHYFISDYYNVSWRCRYCGQSVRPVFDSPAKTDVVGQNHVSTESVAEQRKREDQEKKQREAEILVQQQREAEAAEQARLEEERCKQEEAVEQARLAEEQREQEKAATLKPATGTIAGHEYVDLGLSVKWATCNVGASSPAGYGNYYAWGETTTKSEYIEENKMFYSGNMAAHDTARANWGGSWRMPTEDEMQELVDKCNWTWTILDSHNGYKVTSKTNGNSIFLPAAGLRRGKSFDNVSKRGAYWSSTYKGHDTRFVCLLDFFVSDNPYLAVYYSYVGLCVRPVSE